MRAEELTEQKYRTRYITPLYKILKNPSLLLLSAITLLGAGLRLYRLSYQSFWEDELYSWWASSFTGPAMVIRVGVLPDIHPPGYQLLMYLVQRLGAEGELGLRLPSAVAGILAIPLLYWLGYKLYGPMEGLIAAALLAVLHFPIYYSQEARSYALVLLFVLLTAVLSLDLFSAKPQHLTPYLLLPAAIVLASLHYYGLLFVILLGGTAVFLTIRYRRDKMRLVLRLFGLVGAAYLLWLPGIITQLQISNRGLWITPPGNIVETFLALFYQFFNQRWLPAYLMLGLILVAVISRLKKRKTYKNLPNATLFLLLWLVIPFGMTYLFSVLVTPIFTYRNLIIILPAALLLAARGLTQIPPKWGQIGAASLLTGVLLWQVVGGDYYTAPHKTQFREAAAIIVNQEAEDALIIRVVP